MDDLNEKCGIFGVFGKDLEVARLTFFGLFALQHRGQESSGIAAANGYGIHCYKNVGLVSQVFTEENIQSLTGFAAIGHNRYSTSEGTGLKHAQPVVIKYGLLALAHNGNLPSVTVLEKFLQDKDIKTENCNDSELMAKAISYYIELGKTLEDAVKTAYPLFTGAFSLLVLTKDSLVAVRDEYGIRPFAFGKIGHGFIFASETCAFKTIGAEFVREINPGEMVLVNSEGVKTFQLAKPKPKIDIFEYVYFARPDSEICGKSVYEVRRNCGIELAKEFPINVDIVVPVPETAIPVAAGYSQSLNIPMELALVKNRYIHRTFIQPHQHERELGVSMKLTALPGILKDKKVAVIDDSIVRGTTSKQIVKILRGAGASEVHFLVSSPPVKFPDFYGIDTPKQKDLIGAHRSVEEIKNYLDADSLYFLSLSGLVNSIGLPKEELCTSCFTGEYPIDLKEKATEIKQPDVVETKPAGVLF